MGKGDWKRPLDPEKFAKGYEQVFGPKVPWFERDDRYTGEDAEDSRDLQVEKLNDSNALQE